MLCSRANCSTTDALGKHWSTTFLWKLTCQIPKEYPSKHVMHRYEIARKNSGSPVQHFWLSRQYSWSQEFLREVLGNLICSVSTICSSLAHTYVQKSSHNGITDSTQLTSIPMLFIDIMRKWLQSMSVHSNIFQKSLGTDLDRTHGCLTSSKSQTCCL